MDLGLEIWTTSLSVKKNFLTANLVHVGSTHQFGSKIKVLSLGLFQVQHYVQEGTLGLRKPGYSRD